MLEMIGEFAIGAALVVVAVILVFIGIPKHGESPRFLRFDASVVIYPAVIMSFLAFGVGLMLRAYAG
jgi:ABC-type multidrug transport system permease subunit